MAERKPEGRLRTVAEDMTGFGAGELRMTRDLVLRPRTVAMAQGEADSPYPRAFRYFLALTGLYLLVIALVGGFENTIEGLPSDLIEAARAASGKSLGAFMADVDQWCSLLAVPVIALSLYPPLRLLFGRWSDPTAAGGQAFAFISGWTLWGVPLGLASLVAPSMQPLSQMANGVIVVGLFAAMGRSVWWWTAGMLATRLMLLVLLVLPAMAVGGVLIITLGLLGATWAP